MQIYKSISMLTEHPTNETIDDSHFDVTGGD